MTRRNSNNDNAPERSKIEVFYAKAEGSSQSLQDLMRALTTAIGRPPQVTPRTALLSDGANAHGGTASDSSEAEATETSTEELQDSVDDATANGSIPGTRRKRGNGPKKDYNAGLMPVPDINFMPDGALPLRQFFSEKAPEKDMEQVLVLAYYLQFTLKLDNYGVDHLLTAFKHVGRPVPADLRQTVRNMKTKKAWLGFEDLDVLRVTTIGDNVVVHELPHSVK